METLCDGDVFIKKIVKCAIIMSFIFLVWFYLQKFLFMILCLILYYP